jgi:soluble lytic murein transglycosylase-like protein
MQLMPATAKRLGVQNSFDPEQNIQGGTKHFRFLMDSFNEDLELSLAAYNAGENLVQRLGRVPEIKETLDYVRSITKRFSQE